MVTKTPTGKATKGCVWFDEYPSRYDAAIANATPQKTAATKVSAILVAQRLAAKTIGRMSISFSA
jgi:hypothetical protein